MRKSELGNACVYAPCVAVSVPVYAMDMEFGNVFVYTNRKEWKLLSKEAAAATHIDTQTHTLSVYHPSQKRDDGMNTCAQSTQQFE